MNILSNLWYLCQDSTKSQEFRQNRQKCCRITRYHIGLHWHKQLWHGMYNLMVLSKCANQIPDKLQIKAIKLYLKHFQQVKVCYDWNITFHESKGTNFTCECTSNFKGNQLAHSSVIFIKTSLHVQGFSVSILTFQCSNWELKRAGLERVWEGHYLQWSFSCCLFPHFVI